MTTTHFFLYQFTEEAVKKLSLVGSLTVEVYVPPCIMPAVPPHTPLNDACNLLRRFHFNTIKHCEGRYREQQDGTDKKEFIEIVISDESEGRAMNV